jgi:predicted dehydrogenase
VDIVTRVETHLPLVRLAVERKIPIICQKPIATDWLTALEMVDTAESAGVPLMIHENWRWQAWYRAAHEMIVRGDIGRPIGYGFRTRTRDGVGDAPYAKQPYFRQLRRLLIDETLVHHIDTARFLFGEIDSVCAQASRRNPNVVAEDQAILVLTHQQAVHGWIDGHRFLDPDPDGPAMGDAFFDGEGGTISILATGDVYLNRAPAWKNDVTAGYRGDSVRATQAHFIRCLATGVPFESGGRPYLRTFAAVEAAYRSVADARCVSLDEILGIRG